MTQSTLIKTTQHTIRKVVQLAAGLNIKIPTAFTSSFTVDTISGQLNWTDTNLGTAEYEVYANTNEAGRILIATTLTGANAYTDTTAKQNASIVYEVRAKKGIKFSDFVAASALTTPLCWKTNQSVLTPHVINTLNITVGKSVTVNYSDGTSQAYSGNNTNITKNFASTGQYNVWLSGDTNFIENLVHKTQIKTYGNITNFVLPYELSNIQMSDNSLSGSLPSISENLNKSINVEFQTNAISGSNALTFRKSMTQLKISFQTVQFPTSEIDKLLKAAADWYQVNAPTANCTFNMSGANMGIPTGGASNTDAIKLVNDYTVVSKVCNLFIRTS